MAQVKLLKIASDGVPLEFDSAADDVTLNSYTVQGGGPVLSSTGLDLNNQDVVDVNDVQFNNPATGTINQTAGNLIIDNIMAKERSNAMTTAGDILFPVISDTAGQVDAFRLPSLAGVPTATPTTSGEGFIVWDSSNNHLYAWDGSAWDNLSTAVSSQSVQNTYTAAATIAARDVVYISAADSVSPADADAVATSYAIGLAVASASATNPVTIQENGIMSGFSSLTSGARYYLSSGTAGTITSTIPSGSGHTVVQVGYAKSATALQIQIQNLGRRA